MTTQREGLQPTRDCSCPECVLACQRAPGVFAPGEAEKAAELLGVSFAEFKKRLIKNYWHDQDSDPLMWQPRKHWDDGEEEVASDEYTNRRGRCTFLTAENRCEIQGAKPWECRHALLCEKQIDAWPELNRLWKESGVRL